MNCKLDGMDINKILELVGTLLVNLIVITSVIKSKINAALSPIEDSTKTLKPNGGSSLADIIPKIYERLCRVDASLSYLANWKSAWMEIASQPIFLTDAAGNCTWVNMAYKKLCGASFEELQGSNWNRVIYPEDLTKVSEEWTRAVKNQSFFDLTYRFVNIQTNTYSIVHCKAKPLYKDGVLSNYIGVFDIIDTNLTLTPNS